MVDLVKQSNKYNELADIPEQQFQALVATIAESIEPIIDHHLGLQADQWEVYNENKKL